MFKLNLKIALRNLWKNKGFSIINIGGLAIGLASCMILLIYVAYEWGYDKQFANHDQTYVVHQNAAEFEADGREMMALVDNQLAVIGDEVADLTVAHEALDQRDVDPPRRLALSAADCADVAVLHGQKRLKAFAPLVDELAAMDENQRVDAACGDHARADDGLAERRRSGQHAIIVGFDRSDGGRLYVVQCAEKFEVQWPTRIAFIFELRRGSVQLQQFDSFVEAATRQADVVRMKLSTRDDARLAEHWQPHGLRAIELWVLKCRDPDELGHHRRRQARTVDIDLIAKHDIDVLGHRFLGGLRLASSRRCHLPRLVRVLVIDG